MKTMILSASDSLELVDAVNKFIKDKKVIDIKYISIPINTFYSNGNPVRVSINDRVLIMYEEEPNE